MPHPRWSVLSTSLLLALASCSHATRSAGPAGGAASDILTGPQGQRIITEKAIEKSGARTAWDALQRTVPFYSFNENSKGRPARIEHRGRSSIVLRDQPMIIMDGVELMDFSVLGVMPATDIFEIEVLTGVDATTYYGTGATKGVIRIWTKTAPT